MLLFHQDIELETDEKTKQEYYETVESSIEDPAIFENFIQKKIQEQEKRNSVIPSRLNLCIAARDGDIILTIMLLKAGINPNEYPPNVKNWTPLHYACSKGNLMVVMYLVTHRADISKKNEANKTSLELIKDLDLIKQISFIQEQYKTYQEKRLLKSKITEKA